MSEKLPLHQPSPTAAPSKRAPLARLLLAGALISYIAYTSLATPNRLGDAALSIIDNLQPVPASLKGDKGASCPVQYDFPGEKEKTWNPEEDKEYVEMAVEKLRGAVRIVSPFASSEEEHAVGAEGAGHAPRGCCSPQSSHTC